MIQEPTIYGEAEIKNLEEFLIKQERIKNTQGIELNLRNGIVLVEQTITISAFALRMNPLHNGKTNEQIIKFIKETDSKEHLKVVGIGPKVKDIKLGDIPLINWSNSLSLRYVDIPNYKFGVIQTSADFHNIGKKNMAQMNVDKEDIVAKEYLLVQEHVIEATY